MGDSLNSTPLPSIRFLQCMFSFSCFYTKYQLNRLLGMLEPFSDLLLVLYYTDDPLLLTDTFYWFVNDI